MSIARAAVRTEHAQRVALSWEAGRALVLIISGLASLAALTCLHVSQGAANIGFADAVQAVLQPDGSLEHEIVRYVRLPRAAIGILCGSSLAMAGVLLQVATRNSVSSPATLGINSGAYLALVAASVFAPGLASFSPLLLTFGGGCLAVLLVYVIAGGVWATPLRLILGGAAVSMTLAAVTAAIQIIYENETSGLFLWGSGTLIQQDWSETSYALPRLAIAAAIALALAPHLDVLQLGEDMARSLGQRTQFVRLTAAVTALLLAATSVAVAGPIGFIGLMVPHFARLLGMRRDRKSVV